MTTSGNPYVVLRADAVPALGDVRAACAGDVILLHPGVSQRRDWGRYAEAIAQAVTRGADVRWVRL